MLQSTFPTLRVFFRTCYLPLRLRGKSKDSIRLHEITLNNFAKFLGREPLLSDLESDSITCFLSWMRSRGRAAITANDNLNRLMALARFAVKKHVLAEEPDVEPDIEPERVVRAWLTAELESLFATCGQELGFMAAAPAGLWWVALHLICLFTGERITAVLSLRWDQIDFSGKWMMLTAEQRKGRKRDKEWPLPLVAITALKSLRPYTRGDRVFEYDCCLGTIYNRYTKILRRAGLPNDRQSKFHRIRKSTASHFAAAGGNATELLDHSSIRVTKKYLDKRIVKDKAASDLLKPPAAASRFFCHGKQRVPRKPRSRKIG